MPKRKKIFVGLTLDPDIVEQCKKIAESKDRSFSYYVNKILGQELLNVNKPTDRKPIKKEKEETQQYRFWKMFEPNKKEILKYTKNAKKISEDLFLANVEKNHVGNQDGKFHLKIIIASKELKVMSRIESNKKIYKILDNELKETIHSIQILIT